MLSAQFLVFSNPAEGREDEYNRWYDQVHLGEVKAVPGVEAARRYHVKPLGDGAPRHRYLAVYDLSGDDPAATLGRILARAQGGGFRMSDALDPHVETLLVEALPPVDGAS